LLGNYFKDENKKEDAIKYFNLALTREVTTVQDREAIENSIKQLNN